jgi:hypothetical protein
VGLDLIIQVSRDATDAVRGCVTAQDEMHSCGRNPALAGLLFDSPAEIDLHPEDFYISLAERPTKFHGRKGVPGPSERHYRSLLVTDPGTGQYLPSLWRLAKAWLFRELREDLLRDDVR